MKEPTLRYSLPRWSLWCLGFLALFGFLQILNRFEDTTLPARKAVIATPIAPPPAPIDTRRFNLTLSERQQLFKEEDANEFLTDAEQIRLYPTSGIKQAEYWDKTSKRRRAVLAAKYHLSSQQLQMILTEGVEANWPKQ